MTKVQLLPPALKNRQLLSLIGQLQHKCCKVRPGRTLLRRMISLAKVAKELHHHIRLSKKFRSDLQWWACFLLTWNGISMMSGVSYHHDIILTPDTSGCWGCAAFSSTGKWFQPQWPESWIDVHIAVKDLLPIRIAVGMWGNTGT